MQPKILHLTYKTKLRILNMFLSLLTYAWVKGPFFSSSALRSMSYSMIGSLDLIDVLLSPLEKKNHGAMESNQNKP